MFIVHICKRLIEILRIILISTHLKSTKYQVILNKSLPFVFVCILDVTWYEAVGSKIHFYLLLFDLRNMDYDYEWFDWESVLLWTTNTQGTSWKRRERERERTRLTMHRQWCSLIWSILIMLSTINRISWRKFAYSSENKKHVFNKIFNGSCIQMSTDMLWLVEYTSINDYIQQSKCISPISYVLDENNDSIEYVTIAMFDRQWISIIEIVFKCIRSIRVVESNTIYWQAINTWEIKHVTHWYFHTCIHR
jgi:hypothetical protein